MQPTTTSASAPAGALAKTLRRLFMRSAQMTEVQTVSPHFRLITLAGDGLKGVTWVPGEKIQVAMQGLATRTYTPLCWDAQQGLTRLLGYAHGAAPGAQWLLAAKAGDACQFLGPRRSIQLHELSRPALFVGDETSFALAYALRHTEGSASDVKFLFEVNSHSESHEVIHAMGINPAVVIERQANDAHWPQLEAHALEHLLDATQPHICLTGKSTTIQHLQRLLRGQNVRSNSLATKAYWAPGKAGLD